MKKKTISIKIDVQNSFLLFSIVFFFEENQSQKKKNKAKRHFKSLTMVLQIMILKNNHYMQILQVILLC